MERQNFIIVANSYVGQALSGSDRIFIELCRRLRKYYKVFLIVNEQGKELCKKQKLNTDQLILWPQGFWQNFGEIISFPKRTWNSLFKKIPIQNPKNTTLYTASHFWPDVFAGYLTKKRYPQITWVAGFYLFVPLFKPHFKLINLFHNLVQTLSFYLVRKSADFVCVTSQPDIKIFEKAGFPKEKIFVFRGGVRIPSQNKLKKLSHFKKRLYDAVFVGRLHHQKGLQELVKIWAILTKDHPQFKLVIIGEGPEKKAIQKLILKLGLLKNIKLLGFLDGQKKEAIFAQSKIIVHPAIYDSGGMAAAEGMAWGLPAVSFDLEALKTYYPYGMLKVPAYNLTKFAKVLKNLLNNQKLYRQTSKKARLCAQNLFNWQERIQNFLKLISYVQKS